MEDRFIEYCVNHWPTITIILLVILLTAIATWKTAKGYLHWTTRIKKTEEDCQKTDQHILPQLSSMNASIISLNKSVNGLIIYLKGKDGKLDASLFQAFSPIRLTEVGEAVLDALDGRKIVDAHTEALFKEIRNQHVQTALDVQNITPIIISNFSSREEFKTAKDFIFRNPVFRYTNKIGEEVSLQLDLDTLNMVLGMYLRDKFLESHPDILPTGIKHQTPPAA